MADAKTDNLICDASTFSPLTRDARSMNIAQASQVFGQYGASLYPDFEALADVFRKLNIQEPVANSNFLHALSLTDLMFRHADSKLEMVTGGHGDGFIGLLKQSFCEMLTRIRKNNGKARVIVLDGDTAALRRWANGEYKDVLEVREATVRPNAVVRHFIVADDDMTRDEEAHEKLGPTSDANQVKAKVYFRNPETASLFSSRFAAMWEAVSVAKAT